MPVIQTQTDLSKDDFCDSYYVPQSIEDIQDFHFYRPEQLAVAVRLIAAAVKELQAKQWEGTSIHD